MQTNLEKYGIESRGNNISNNEYFKNNNEYDNGHKNTLSDGDEKGKGIGYDGHTHTKPGDSEVKTIVYGIATENDNVGGKDDITARKSLKTISLYNENEKYDENHKNALSDGDKRGKGTNNGGHTHYKPWDKENKTVAYGIAVENNNVGGKDDIIAREQLKTISLYNENYQYGLELIDTSANLTDGQIHLF